MEEDDRAELQALVVGFLQQSLKERPDGYSLQEFERIMPEKCDEDRDWYRKKYNKPTALEALKCIQGAIRLTHNSRYNTTYVSLNLQSDKVDRHLIDLITHQKSTNKKRGRAPPRPSSRAFSSFSLNKQYNGPNSNRSGNCRLRLNHGQQNGGYANQYIQRSTSPQLVQPRPSLYSKTSARMVSGDPRSRSSISSPMVPPQVRPVPTLHSSRPPPQATVPKPNSVDPPTSLRSMLSSQSKTASTQSGPTQPKQSKIEEDPLIVKKKHYLGSRLVSLLNRKFADIKLLHLSSIYKLDFEETIDPAAYNHKTLTGLMQDEILAEYVELNLRGPLVTISAKRPIIESGKENMEVNGLRKDAIMDSDLTNTARSKSSQPFPEWGPLDVFNVGPMLQSLEPISGVREPPMGNYKVEPNLKYKTLRIILSCPDKTLKLDDWERKFEQESRLRINIRDYGYRRNLEFFKDLAKDLPITIRLKQDDWVAVTDVTRLTEWIDRKINEGEYKALQALSYSYELIAFPDDKYTYVNPPEIISQGYIPANILSAKSSSNIWIQAKSSKKVEEHLCLEATMTCYEDYMAKKMTNVPNSSFIKPGFPCAVYDKVQQKWCRALVISEPDDEYCIRALLVDYGVDRSFPMGQISCLMKVHLKMPVGTIYSRLDHVLNHTDEKVQKRARMVLQEYTTPPVTLACRFLRAEESKNPEYLPKDRLLIELIDTRYGKDSNIAESINLPTSD